MSERITQSPQGTERPLSANRLAQYATRRGRCERYLCFSLFPSEARLLRKRYDIAPEPLSPLLSGEGIMFEEEVVAQIAARFTLEDLTDANAAAFIAAVRGQADGSVLYSQPLLRGEIGGWDCEGRADLIEIARSGDRVSATVVDIKASRRESVAFRLQIAFYARLLRDALVKTGLHLDELRGAVLAREADLAHEPFKYFDLALYDDEIDRLVGSPASDVARVATKPFSEARYHLGPKCDGCQFNPLCFIDSAEREDLSLVPHMKAVEKRALEAEGIRSARDLALLMEYGDGRMVPAPGREAVAARVGGRWPLGGKLPMLVERARAAMHHYDATIEARSRLLASHPGTLPDPARYPDLVQIFVDAQRDYINDRLYLIAARVDGPDFSEEIVEMTAGPPDDGSERELLEAWIGRLFAAIARAGGKTSDGERQTPGFSAPLHVYLYDRRDQRALLDALTRHFERLALFAPFHELLTASPALTQQMISFLADEARSQRNLPPVCWNLYRVARAFGFDWQDGDLAFWRRFRARAFDYQKSYRRDVWTGLFQPATRADVSDSDLQSNVKSNVKSNVASDVQYVESAARFGAQIPLEYAYAAWNRLRETRDMKDFERAHLRGFQGVTAEEIKQLAVHRTRALAHLASRLSSADSPVSKQPIELHHFDPAEIGAQNESGVEPQDAPLHMSLADFLRLEHYARLQELFLHLSQSPELRAQTGRTLVVEFDRIERNSENEEAIFRHTTAPDLDALRLRTDDWVVLNSETGPFGRARSASHIVHGQLAIITRLDGEEFALRLLPLNFRDSPFRYRHARITLQPGARYTIDESADDLNADKYLDACNNAGANHLYLWMSDVKAGRAPRRVRPSRLRSAAEFAGLASQAQSPHGLTEAQRRLVGEGYSDRVIVVQGPPGTGKSHTIGLAILARMLSLKSRVRSFRVAVAAKTHAATEIVLRSVAARRRELCAAFPGDEMLKRLDALRIVKAARSRDESMPEGVEALPVYGDGAQTAAMQWLALMHQPFLVVGGTPGGLYSLIQKGAGELDWTREYFDLVVVDEASQMGVAEALTSAAFLRSDGQFIAVGDHRQMPPILQHAWDEESRRDLRKSRPHLSIFEYLKALEFPQAPLDESFRIPAEIAEFLRRHVYAADGINFRSLHRRRLDFDASANPDVEPWAAAALAPEHPMILIEHEEEGSQQSNVYEAELAARLAELAMDRLGLDAENGIGIVAPHRAQRALLSSRIPALAGAIDTVERFQGGEREMILVSATVSDREYAQAESTFLLDPRRLTVAISRPRRKLIVIAGRTVFDLMADDVNEYERLSLWKRLYHEAKHGVLWEGDVGGYGLRVRTIGEQR
jgi:hypothetical protein